MLQEPDLTPARAADAVEAVDRIGTTVSATARRWLRRYLAAMGVAWALGVVALGGIERWQRSREPGEWMFPPPPVLSGIVLAVLIGAAYAVASGGPVRAIVSRRDRVVLVVVVALVFGATMGLGAVWSSAYVVGAIMLLGVWLLAAAWLTR